jgi:hypothetical protein
MPKDLFAGQSTYTPKAEARDLFAAPAGGGGSDPASPVEQAGPTIASLEKRRRELVRNPVQAKTDADLALMFGYDFGKIRQSPSYREGDLMKLWQERGAGQASPDSPGKITRAGAGVLKGVEDIGMGLIQLGTRAMPGSRESTQQYVDLRRKVADLAYRNWYGEGNTAGSIGEFLGAAALPAGKAGTLGKGLQMTKPLIKTAAIGAAYGAAQPVDTNPQDDDFWRQKAIQTGTAAVLAPAGRVAVERGIAPALGRTINAVKDHRAPKATFQDLAQEAERMGFKTMAALDEAAGTGNVQAQQLRQSMVEAMGRERGVRLSAGDIKRQGRLQTEVNLEKVPESLGGMSGFREAQHQEIRKALVDQLDDLKSALGVGDDFDLEILQSASRRLREKSQKASKLYDDVSKAAGKKEAVRSEMVAKLDEFLADNARSANPDQSLANELETIRRRLTQTSVEAQKIGETPMDRTYEGLRWLRSRFGKDAAKYEATDASRARIYKELRNAAKADLDQTALQSGNTDLIQKHRAADKFWREEVAPYKLDNGDYRSWARALQGKEAEPEKVFQTFMRANAEGKARYFFEGLDQKGRDAVKVGVLTQALEAGTIPGSGTFSPAKAAGELERIVKESGVFFKGKDKWELDGTMKLLRHVQRAGQYMENPPTGQQLVAPALGAAAATAAERSGGSWWRTAVGILGTSHALRLLHTSPAGKRFLLAASDLKVGSPAMDRLINRMVQQLPPAASTAANPGPARMVAIPEDETEN